jgi:hypothetical protein
MKKLPIYLHTCNKQKATGILSGEKRTTVVTKRNACFFAENVWFYLF